MSEDFRNQLLQGQTLIGGWVTLGSPMVAEAVASCGFDWVAIDMEHGSSSVGDALLSFVACERHGALPFVRLPSADPYLARRVLDAGARGLLVPVVESATDFADFANHLHYSPSGRRGIALSRANGWGDDFDSYTSTFRPVTVAMIETRAGVEQAEAIARLDSVDAIFIGPYDLSADLGDPGNFTSTRFQEHLDQIKIAAQKASKPVGYHQVPTDPTALAEKIAEGYSFMAYGLDVTAMRDNLKTFQSVALPGKQ